MRKIYLASPFFNEKELSVYKEVISILRNMKDVEVYVPQEFVIESAYDMPNNMWAEKVFKADVKALRECEFVFVLNFGMYSDSGTAWEAGYAYALDKKVYQVICLNDEKVDYSLMMLNGANKVITLNDLRKGVLPEKEETLSNVLQK